MVEGVKRIIHKKNIKQYHNRGIKVSLEIPEPDIERDKNGISNIKKIMNTELLLQINNKNNCKLNK